MSGGIARRQGAGRTMSVPGLTEINELPGGICDGKKPEIAGPNHEGLGMMAAIGRVALGLLLAATCWLAAPAVEPAEWYGVTATVRELRTVTARNQAGWAALWIRAGQDPPVAFDPATNIAVGVFLGARPTGGFAAEIVSAEEQDGVLTIAWRELRPAPRAIVTQAFTSPWVIRLLPRTERPVAFKQAHEGGASR